MKLMIVGHGRHGKDTMCEILSKIGYSFESSSHFASKFIYKELKHKYFYDSPEECYDDRHNHRSEWYDLISAFNADDPARMSRLIFEEYDIYCGNRNKVEFNLAKEQGLFDLSVWVDASKRLPPEDSSSNTITPDMCDIIINNNGTLEEFERRVLKLFQQ